MTSDRLTAYGVVWRRSADQVFHQSDDELPRVDVYRFPPTRRFWAPASRMYIYATAGMSDMPQPHATEEPRRIELSALVRAKDTGPPNQPTDLVARALHDLSRAPFQRTLFLGPLHTVDMGAALAPGSSMTGYFFAVTPGVSQKALARAVGTDAMFIQPVPVSDREMHLAIENGSEALLNALENHGVPPYFDLERPSVV